MLNKYCLKIILIILISSTNQLCGNGKTLSTNEKNVASCIDCSENCQICYKEANNKLICGYCKEGFYMTPKKICKPCVNNCSRCVGDKLNQCQNPEMGFFYNLRKKQIEKCGMEGCAHCPNENECTNCLEGFYVASRKLSNENVNIVQCKKCDIENCKFCKENEDQVKNNKYLTCSLCKTGFGLVSGKCEPCPNDCLFCKENNSLCSICKRGFRFDKEKNTCDKIPIDFCYSMINNEECKICESQFFLENNTCKTCSSKIENCHYCHIKEEFNCISCNSGYHSKDKKCEKCAKNCNHCNETNCLVCKEKHFLSQDRKNCKKCDLKNCLVCATETVCKQCRHGMFFNKEEKKCKKCPMNCLRCTSDGQNCMSCPLNYYTLEEELISHNTSNSKMILPNIFSLIFGAMLSSPSFNITQIKIINKCVERCPKEVEGKKVIVDESKRKCRVVINKDMEKNVHTLDLPATSKDDTVLDTIMALKVKYDEEIMNLKKSSLINDALTDNSAECFNHGMLDKKIKADSSFYICKCDDGYMGDNCQISSHLYKNVQKNIIQIFKKMETDFVNHNMHSQKLILKAFILVNKFKLSKMVLDKMIFLLSSTLSHNKEMDNKRELYILYDAILLNLFDLLEDIRKKSSEELASNIELKKLEKKIYVDIHLVMQMLENSLEELKYAQSFLDRGSIEYITFDTYSYTISEYRFKDFKDKDSSFKVNNPNIDTSFNINAQNSISFKFKEGFKIDDSPYNLQILTFSAQLFRDHMEIMRDTLITNVLYLKNIDSTNLTKRISNNQAGLKKVILNFAMLFIPSFVDNELKENIYCKAYSFAGGQNVLSGKVIDVDDDEQTVTCEFYSYFEFRNHYFAVSMMK